MSPHKLLAGRRGHRAAILIWGALIGAGLFGTGYMLATGTESNCDRIHRIVVAGERILDTPETLRDAYHSGRISRRVYQDALAQIRLYDPVRERNLAIWRSADCQ
jgi:hypothetical protein